MCHKGITVFKIMLNSLRKLRFWVLKWSPDSSLSQCLEVAKVNNSNYISAKNTDKA